MEYGIGSEAYASEQGVCSRGDLNEATHNENLLVAVRLNFEPPRGGEWGIRSTVCSVQGILQ